MRERCASEIVSVQTTFSFKLCKLSITQMFSPLAFCGLIALRRKMKKKFAFVRNTAASVTTYEITSFVATHNFYFKVISSKCVATTNRQDETPLQIHVVNLAFKEVAGNSYLMSSLNSHLHFIVSVV